MIVTVTDELNEFWYPIKTNNLKSSATVKDILRILQQQNFIDWENLDDISDLENYEMILNEMIEQFEKVQKRYPEWDQFKDKTLEDILLNTSNEYLPEQARLQLTETILWRKITDQQKEAIITAHNYSEWKYIPFRDLRKHPEQLKILQEKKEILLKGWFWNKYEIQKLFDNCICISAENISYVLWAKALLIILLWLSTISAKKYKKLIKTKYKENENDIDNYFQEYQKEFNLSWNKWNIIEKIHNYTNHLVNYKFFYDEVTKKVYDKLKLDKEKETIVKEFTKEFWYWNMMLWKDIDLLRDSEWIWKTIWINFLFISKVLMTKFGISKKSMEDILKETEKMQKNLKDKTA